MKQLHQQAAQGDIYLTKVSNLPKGVEAVPPEENDDVILTHSETGHYHVVSGDTAVLYRDPTNPLKAWLDVKKPTVIRHLREHHTHEPIGVDQGVHRINRQRAFHPKGQRRVLD